MARPSKKYKVWRNGDTFQCYIDDDYVGSISAKKLCENLYAIKRKPTE